VNLDRRLILIVGKGGVGRSTVAAAVAGKCAAQGRRTLLYETNANDRLGPYFGRPPVGEALTQLAPNLWAVNATPASALAEYGMMILRWKSVYEMVFENRVSKAFLRAIPGLDDYAMLGKAWYHTAEEKRGAPVWDTVVFDMPASGHSVSMLRVPWVTRDARTIKAMLCDPARTSTVLVTLAEEMPVNEAIELETKLIALGIVPHQMLVNQVFPRHFPPGQPVARVLDALLAEPSSLVPPLAQLAAHAALSRDRRALHERYLAELRTRARARVDELPMLFAQSLGPAEITRLGERIAGL
jgi:anion-transporting  ArsA/GET3 family ATPase